MEWLQRMTPLEGTVLCSLFTWGMTALGAASVFCFRKVKGSWLDACLGFGAGVMLAASFWSLLAPAIELSQGWKMAAFGFFCGSILILEAERWVTRGRKKQSKLQQRGWLLVLAVTLHNILEGMVVGVAFANGGTWAPWILAMGIALQNIPEGAAVALPLRREGLPARKSFILGQASGMVEPIFSLVALWLGCRLDCLLPFLLSFSAGSMVMVVGGELLPEAVSAHKQLSLLGFMVGFLLMMIMDVALG